MLIVGHGSRRREANDDVREVARMIGERGEFPLVQPAFLEIEHPNVAEGFEALVSLGASSITVHPYFLSPGRHTRGDIPVEVAAVAERFPKVSYRISEPLAAHNSVIEASVDRIRQSIRNDSRMLDQTIHGCVYLVGAGPGDPELLTIKAHRLISLCDLLIYDNLVNPELLRIAPSAAEKIYVGKIGGGRHTPQTEINRLLVEHGRLGKRVVRLKGGDPFLFGRGGEEAEALAEADVRFEVVPGISSALAVPAYAGIPLTHRGLSSSVAVITASRSGDGTFNPSVFEEHRRTETLVVLMGASQIRKICECLIDSGRNASTPVAVVRWGTYRGQVTIEGTLNSIADACDRNGIRSPAVIVIGEVVSLRKRLKWFESLAANQNELEKIPVLA